MDQTDRKNQNSRTPAAEGIRINKYLSDKGICSRREADRLIEEGAVLVNGEPAAAGQKVTGKDEITVRGEEVIAGNAPKKVVLAVNKPAGVTCTTRTFQGEKNIVDLVNYESRLYPVGRLDKESTGLIFMTNDGAFAREITDAAGRHEKEYEVTVNREITDEFLKRMERGMFLYEIEKYASKCKVVKKNGKTFRITLTQGLNRQIRRMCETCGYEVLSLKRIRIMNVGLEDLKEGEYRILKGEELKILMTDLEKGAYRKNLRKAAEEKERKQNTGSSRKMSEGNRKAENADRNSRPKNTEGNRKAENADRNSRPKNTERSRKADASGKTYRKSGDQRYTRS